MARRFKARATGMTLVALAAAGLAACGESASLERGEAAEPTRVRIIVDPMLEAVVTSLASSLEEARDDVAVDVVLATDEELRDRVADVNSNDDDSDDIDVIIGSTSGVDVLRAEQVLAGDPLVFGSNMLVIAVPKGNPGNVEDLRAFEAGAEPKTGICPPESYCGGLARYAFSRAGIEAEPDLTAPDGITLLFQIVSGELDAGLLMRTQAASQLDTLSIISIPDEFNQVQDFSIAAVRASPVIDDVVDWLASSSAAGEILSSSGLRDAPGES
jgi:molybdate transport system substrate-binding protein